MLARLVLRNSRLASNAKGAIRRTTARSTTSSSSHSATEAAASPFALNAAGVAASVLAVGSCAWYYHLFGQDTIYAMTPAEEGYDVTASMISRWVLISGYSLHATKYPWEHEQFTKTFDHQALRRGFQVYREVCSSCHSLARVPWRSMVGATHTVDEMKAMAEENEYDTEPNDEGEIEKRPGKLSDYIPKPYKNDEAARAANNGALPPDLSLMVKARHGGCNYIFSLLTGYPEEPPPGATVASGLNFNPYFPGTGIAMARVLYDGLVEYDDGTPATTSQMAKDVVEFLNFAAEPEMDQRKKMGVAVITITTVLLALSIWVKRYKWSPVKTRKLMYDPPIKGPGMGSRGKDSGFAKASECYYRRAEAEVGYFSVAYTRFGYLVISSVLYIPNLTLFVYSTIPIPHHLFSSLSQSVSLASVMPSCCGRTFTGNGMRNHLDNASQHTNEIECRWCWARWPSHDGRRRLQHEQREHWLSCGSCTCIFENESALQVHKEEEHPPNYCYECQRSFMNLNNLNQHLKSSTHVGKPAKCPWCPCKFTNLTGVCLHLESGACPSGINRQKIDNYCRQIDTQHFFTNKQIGWHADDSASYSPSIATGAAWDGSCEPGPRAEELPLSAMQARIHGAERADQSPRERELWQLAL
ncbi:hypothetical protein G7Y79_00002g008360 [Physcia stellaris]|nr:hypothetical protein G7Y79_00002g008360 [Physcia stellaris]